MVSPKLHSSPRIAKMQLNLFHTGLLPKLLTFVLTYFLPVYFLLFVIMTAGERQERQEIETRGKGLGLKQKTRLLQQELSLDTWCVLHQVCYQGATACQFHEVIPTQPNITKANPLLRYTEINRVECKKRTVCLVVLMHCRPPVDITCSRNSCQDTEIATELIKAQLRLEKITKNEIHHGFFPLFCGWLCTGCLIELWTDKLVQTLVRCHRLL